MDFGPKLLEMLFNHINKKKNFMSLVVISWILDENESLKLSGIQFLSSWSSDVSYDS